MTQFLQNRRINEFKERDLALKKYDEEVDKVSDRFDDRCQISSNLAFKNSSQNF